MTEHVAPPPELHRPFPIERIKAGSVEESVVATPEECAALATRLLVPAVRSLSCRFRLTALGGGIIQAEGWLKARVARVCVITLEEFDSKVEEKFQVRFVPESLLPRELEEQDDDAPGDDPEADDELPYAGSVLDLGEAAAEQLALGLDPYPRKPGAVLPAEAQDEPESPFAALARLKTLR